MSEEGLFKYITHSTDFTKESDRAYYHALRLAITGRGLLRILHVDAPKTRTSWSQFPKIRETLELWRLLPVGSAKDDLKNIGLSVRKYSAKGESPQAAICKHLERHPSHLLVVSNHQRDTLKQFLQPSVALSVFKEAKIPTLFIPAGSDGFVDRLSGDINLSRILVPVDKSPSPQEAINYTSIFLKSLGVTQVKISLLHVSPEPSDFPVDLPTENAGWQWEKVQKDGDPVACILETAKYLNCQCIVMATEGRKGLKDAIKGSTTERILNQVQCPVFSFYA